MLIIIGTAGSREKNIVSGTTPAVNNSSTASNTPYPGIITAPCPYINNDVAPHQFAISQSPRQTAQPLLKGKIRNRKEDRQSRKRGDEYRSKSGALHKPSEMKNYIPLPTFEP